MRRDFMIGYGERDRLAGHRVEGGKPPFAQLLFAAGFVELDDLHELAVGEIRDRWVVKCDVSVLSNTDECEVDRICREKLGVTRALCLRVCRVATDVVKGAGPKGLVNARAQPQAKTGRMIRLHRFVFVKMECIRLVPANSFFVTECGDELKLRGSGRKEQIDGALSVNGSAHAFAGGERGRLPQGLFILIHAHARFAIHSFHDGRRHSDLTSPKVKAGRDSRKEGSWKRASTWTIASNG